MDTVTENLHVARTDSPQDNSMDRPADDAPEHEKCKWWRLEKMELTREQLAPLIGFSAASIKDFERAGKDVDPMARKRYRLACAAVQYGIEFDWADGTMLFGGMRITVDKDGR